MSETTNQYKYLKELHKDHPRYADADCWLNRIHWIKTKVKSLRFYKLKILTISDICSQNNLNLLINCNYF